MKFVYSKESLRVQFLAFVLSDGEKIPRAAGTNKGYDLRRQCPLVSLGISNLYPNHGSVRM